MKTTFNFFIDHRKVVVSLIAGICLVPALYAQNASVTVSDAWARVPAPSKSETALYMVVENRGSQPRAIVSVSSDAASKVEMHEMKMMKKDSADAKKGGMPNMDKNAQKDSMPNMAKTDEMMVMTPVSQISIPAKGKTTLGPNGFHMMLFGLKSKLTAGDKINVTLKLDDGTAVPVTATVRN